MSANDPAPVTGDGGVVEACPATTTGPTVHKGDISGTETWKASESPHIIEADVNVRDGAKLIIEPCAVVKVATDASLNVAFPLTPNKGELVAEGTVDKPIKFEANDADPWGRIFIHHPGKARLAYVTLSGGGGSSTDFGESLALTGDGELPSKKGLYVDHVTVTKSRGLGVKLSAAGAFTADSKALTITGNGDDTNPFPLLVGELGVDTIPEGTYTGNKRDEIVIDPETVSGAGGFQESATMRNRGVPYRFGLSATFDHLHIGRSGSGTTGPSLTIEPGVTLKMIRGAVIELDGLNGPPASIKAVGTADKPIIITSAENSPKPGDWRGFYFNGPVSADNRVEYVHIEYTGADCSCSLVTCSDVSEYEGALIFGEQPPTAFLKNSVIAHASGHGIVAGYVGATLDWKTSNTYEDVAGCYATLPWASRSEACPDPAPACRW